jgi:hypothetical protein
MNQLNQDFRRVFVVEVNPLRKDSKEKCGTGRVGQNNRKTLLAFIG